MPKSTRMTHLGHWPTIPAAIHLVLCSEWPPAETASLNQG
jgi:hypothetical protein